MTEEEETNKDKEQAEKLSPVEQATAAAERLEKANKEMKELLDKQEQLKAKEILAGNTNAGQTEEKKKEDSPEEYANKVMANDL